MTLKWELRLFSADKVEIPPHHSKSAALRNHALPAENRLCSIPRGKEKEYRKEELIVKMDTERTRPTLFDKCDKAIVTFAKGISYLSGIFLVAIMLIAFFNVIGEKLKVAGVPFVGGVPMASALIQYFHIPVVFLAAGYVTLDRGHTRIDMLSSHFPKVVQKFFIILGHLLGAAIYFFISYRAFFVLMVKDITKNVTISTSFVNAWPEWPFVAIHGLGFLVMGVTFLWSVIREIHGYTPAEAGPDAAVKHLEQSQAAAQLNAEKEA